LQEQGAVRLDTHLETVARAILERRVVPFLGAGASLYERGGRKWRIGRNDCLPSTDELTDYLASFCTFPPQEKKDLARVSQYAAVTRGLGPLYEELHEIFFNNEYTPTALHHLLAKIPALHRKGAQNGMANPPRQRLVYPHRQRFVVVTTNYDELMEQAFAEAGEPCHKLVYMADQVSDNDKVKYPGTFIHWTPDGESFLVKPANEYQGIQEYDKAKGLEGAPVIIKIHGGVDRTPP
jgi:hypothetical protein